MRERYDRVDNEPQGDSLDKFHDWATTTLPKLNEGVLQRTISPDAFAGYLTQATAELPDASRMSQLQAKQVTVTLGIAGASMARHRQEADDTLKQKPEKSFEGVVVGQRREPFVDYFAEVADQTGTGHPHRDAFASLVGWNGDNAKLIVKGEEIASIGGVFPDGKIRTYTTNPGEQSFFELLRDTELLQHAANEQLEKLYDLDVNSEEAKKAVRLATKCLKGVHKLQQKFAKLPPEKALTPDHFLDVFRQNAVHWQKGDIPPSGAHDPEYLIRDGLLGIHYAHYKEKLQEDRYPAMLPSEQEAITKALDRETIPDMIIRKLGITTIDLASATPEQRTALLREHRILAKVVGLLEYNAAGSGSHLLLADKYLFRAQKKRETEGRFEEKVVDNHYGTTEMDKAKLVAFKDARRNRMGDIFNIKSTGQLPHEALEPDLSELKIVTSTGRTVTFEQTERSR